MQSPEQMLGILIEYYDALQELARPIFPSRAPNLKSITLPTLAALRQTIGDANGEAGPRAVILAGGTTALDATAGVWVWDPTSTLADNGSTVIQGGSAAIGRWRKYVVSGAVGPTGGAGGTGASGAAGTDISVGGYAGGAMPTYVVDPLGGVLTGANGLDQFSVNDLILQGTEFSQS